MLCIEKFKKIYSKINYLKFELLCKYDYCKGEDILVKEIAWLLMDEDCSCCENECKEHGCNSLIDELICEMCNIEECRCCNKNYAYLLQIDRLKCILRNIKILLCQLKFLCSKDCCLISKVICILIELLELIANIISKINNIECLIESCGDCKCEILECLLCSLTEDIGKIECIVSQLSHLVLQIASQNIINCTTCTNTSKHSCKKHDCSCECSNN